MTGLGSIEICFRYDTCGIPEYQLGSEAGSILILTVKEERKEDTEIVLVAFLVGGGGMPDRSGGEDGGCVSSG